MTTDPIADMLSQIRNAILVGKAQVQLPHSKIKEDVASILVASGFLKSAAATEEAGRKQLVITINDEDSSATITEINRLSRPGRRQYVQAKQMPAVKRGRGLVIVSTPQGVMTGKEAVAKKLGGELICEVY